MVKDVVLCLRIPYSWSRRSAQTRSSPNSIEMVTSERRSSRATSKCAGPQQHVRDQRISSPPCVLERCHPFFIGDVDVSAMIDQELDNLLMLWPTIAQHDRLQQRGPTQIVNVIHIHVAVREQL